MVQIHHIHPNRRPLFEKLFISYFKEIDPSKIIHVNESEQLNYPYLDSYWEDDDRSIYEIKQEGEMIGFVLVNNWIINRKFNADKAIAEFYIIPKYRKQGIGNNVACAIFQKYKGSWEVKQDSKNLVAISFWRRVISNYTKGNYKEVIINEEIIQVFNNVKLN